MTLDVTLPEVLAELDDVGTALFDAATRRAIAKKQATRIRELEDQLKAQAEPPDNPPTMS